MTDLHTLDVEKLAHERAIQILANPALLRAAALVDPRALRRSSALHGLDAFAAKTEFRGRHCVEIGTCCGVTAAILGRFFAKVTTVDIYPNPLKSEVLRVLGATNVRVVEVPDNAAKKALIESLAFDAAYVDGDHAHDTALDWALVRRCGRVLFHECWPQQPPVFELVASLPTREVTLGGPCFALWRESGTWIA